MSNQARVIDVGPNPEDSRQIQVVPTAALARVEIDSAIATAKQYPRDIPRFLEKSLELVEAVAMQKSTREGGEELFYSMPRGGKVIEGPSVRMAEIIAHSYGNCRAGARPVAEEGNSVIVQGVFHDLEANVAVTFEVKRRITKRDGTRYDEDMIAVTTNAACSIAFRNAVLKGVPKTYWLPLYERARKLAGGSEKDASKNRKAVLDYFGKLNIPEAVVLKAAGVRKVSELGPDQIATLRGIATAIRDKETTVEAAFGIAEKEGRQPSQIKEKPAAAQGTITKNQARDALVLIADLHLESTDMAKAMKAVGHQGKLAELPSSKFAALLEALQRMKGA